MNRQQKNRKDRRRFSRLMSLALSASMVLSSSVLAYGSPVMDPNAAAAVIAEQAIEDTSAEQQAGEAAKIASVSLNDTADKLMYGMTFSELTDVIKTNVKLQVRDGDTQQTAPLVFDTDYKFNEEFGLFTISDNANNVLNGCISAGDYQVKFKGAGSYDKNTSFDDIVVDINIAPLTVSQGDSISVNVSSKKTADFTGVYTGKEQKPDIEKVTVSVNKHPKTGQKFVISANDAAGFAHIIGKVDYENNVNVTTASNKAKAIVTLNSQNFNAGSKVGEALFDITAGAGLSENAVIEYTGAKIFNYNGEPQGPGRDNITVTVNGRKLTAGADFTIKYMRANFNSSGAITSWEEHLVEENSKPKSVGTYRAVIVGAGNYAGSEFAVDDPQIVKQLQFEIKGNNDFNENNIEVTVPDQAYSGSTPDVMQSLKVVDRISKATLTSDADYELVRYEDASGKTLGINPQDNLELARRMIEPGYYFIVIQGKGAYKADEMRIPFRIVDGTLANAVVEWTTEPTYDGNPHVPVVSELRIPAKNGLGYVVVDPSDYTYEKDDPREFVDAGTYPVTIVGKNRYKGTEIVAEYSIKAKPINGSDIDITAVNVSSKADGKKRLCVVVRDKSVQKTDENGKTYARELKLGKDYEYKDNGNNTVTIRGLYNYNKETSKTIGTATKMPFADAKITAVLTAGSLQYVNKALTPKANEFTVKEEGTTPVELKADTDYTVVGYADNDKAGTAIAILQGKGVYDGFKQVEFEIKGIDLSANYTILEDGLLKEVSYSPTASKDYASDIRANLDRRVIATTADMAKKTLIRGTDYRVEFRLNGERVTEVRNAGEYTVVVEGMGEYSGELTTTFTIKGTDINTVLEASLSQNSFEYAGQAIEPEVTVKTKANMDALVEGKDYEIVYTDNNKVTDKAYAVVRGIGAYSGSISLEFKITGDPSITPVPEGPQDQVLSVRYDQTLSRQLGLTLYMSGKAQTPVQYKSSNTKVATVSSTGKVTCKAVGTAVITTTAIGNDEYKEATKTLALTVMPKKVGVKSVKTTKKKGQAVVQSATTTAGNDGYQIQYTNNGVTKRVGVKTSKKSVTKTLTKLTSGKKVRVRIRAYKYVDGKAIFGPYCNWKTTTTRVK